MMNKNLISLALCATMTCVASASAQAAQMARLENSGTAAIKGLTIAPRDVTVESYADEEGFHAYAVIFGRYKPASPQWTLSAGDKSVAWRDKGATSGDFSYRAPLEGKSSTVEFTAVTPKGDLEHQSLAVSFPGYDAAKDEAMAHPSTNGKFLVGAQVASIQFRDSRSPDINEIGINVDVDYRRNLFGPDWYIEGYGYATALPLGSGGNDLRFFEVDGRFGRLFSLSDSLQLGVAVGALFETMTASSDNVGFTNAFGPQIQAFLKMPFGNGASADLHAGFTKFSGDSGGVGDHNIDVGVDYQLPGDPKHPITLGLNVELIKLDVQGPDALVTMKSTNGSIGATYGF